MGERVQMNTRPFAFEYDVEWAEGIEQGYERHMYQLFDSIDGEGDEVEVASGEPFCGCDTCITRETLAFLIPRIMLAVEEGRLSRVPDLRSVP